VTLQLKAGIAEKKKNGSVTSNGAVNRFLRQQVLTDATTEDAVSPTRCMSRLHNEDQLAVEDREEGVTGEEKRVSSPGCHGNPDTRS
jgi:hypothetical protein